MKHKNYNKCGYAPCGGRLGKRMRKVAKYAR